MKILVTGGAGYIGSHMVFLLLSNNYEVVVLDNLINSNECSLRNVSRLTNKEPLFVRGDIRDSQLLEFIFSKHSFDAVIHFAGLKSVGDSVSKPMEYYDANVLGSLRLFQAMAKANVKKLVFSSSATVYGDPAEVPITEDCPLAATNPYGATKLHIERMLKDMQAADSAWKIAILRYFNPVGAHPSGMIGEDPSGTPNNLMPYVAQVAVGQREFLSVYGGDYATPDGTGVRDYIHVMDLVEGHLRALAALENNNSLICNLGTGIGYSVLQVLNTFSKASGRDIAYKIVSRRMGDVAKCFADPSRAFQLLDWRATRNLTEMCADHWAWQSSNPNGYQ